MNYHERHIPQFLGLKDVGTITNKSSIQITNIRRSNMGTFPKPIIEISGVPVYDTTSIINWLTLNNIDYDFGLLSVRNIQDAYLEFAVCGLERVGKTRLVTKFCSHEYVLRERLSLPGSAATRVTFKYVIKRYCPETMSFIRYVGANSSLNGIQAPLNELAIKEFLHRIENSNFFSQQSERSGEGRGLNLEDDMVEIHTSVSPLALSILDKKEGEEGEDYEGLIIYDTPGLGGKVKSLYNANVGAYVLMMDDNVHDTFDAAVANMMPQLSGAKVVVTYRVGEQIDNEDEYESMKRKAREGVSKFTDSLSRIVDSTPVINRATDLLNPERTVVPIGSFKSSAVNYAESKFNEEISGALRRMLSHGSAFVEEGYLKKYLDDMVNQDESGNALLFVYDWVVPFVSGIVKHIARSIPIYTEGTYDRNEYLNDGHSRTKHNDGYQTIVAMKKSMEELQNCVYKLFCGLEANDEHAEHAGLSVDLQELLIKYCYKKIYSAIHKNCGISSGNHVFEEFPPITMWVQESIIADELSQMPEIDNHNYNSPLMRHKYVEIMSRHFYSPTWGYVSIRPPYTGEFEHCNKKIAIMEKCKLYSLNTGGLDEFVSNCYNVGLLMLGVYSTLNFFTKYFNMEDKDLETVGKIASALHHRRNREHKE